MISYQNTVRFDNLEFGKYLQLSGYSHSGLKNNHTGVKEAITITDNIRIGALVDGILTDPKTVNMADPLYPYCKEISFKIKEFLGLSISALKSQVSYTSNVIMGDFELPVKGRLDFLLENIATIDIKITKAKNVDDLIKFMGYENQLWHYSKMAKTPKAYLIIYCIPLKRVIAKSVDVSSDTNGFWADKIIDFGKVAA